jgi:hypothetical protein
MLVLLVVWFIFESFMLAFPGLNPLYASTVLHIVIVISVLTIIGVYKVGKEMPTQLLAGFVALIIGTGVFSRESYMRYDARIAAKGPAGTPTFVPTVGTLHCYVVGGTIHESGNSEEIDFR